jgi:type IV pilus assembly protein PilM
VVLGVTNPQVVVREMSVANLPGSELRRSLPFQVHDQLPLPVDRSLLDFYPLENPGTNETVRGLLIAAPKDPVLTTVRAVEKAGLTVDRVDLASFALLRAVSVLDSAVEALVDIGAQSTSIVVHVDGVPLIVRTVPRGGAEVTAALASRLRIEVGEAELLKCRVGLLPDEGPEVPQIVRDAIRPLLSELRSSFGYLASASNPRQVARLALSGGGSLLPGLAELLGSEMGVPVVIADPLIRLRTVRRGRHDGLERFRSSAAVSVGLTLRVAS